MYKIYCDNEILLDVSSDILLIDPVLELAENSAGSFTFGFYPDHPLYDALTPKSRIDFYKDDEWIFSGRPKSIELKFDLLKEVECEGVLAYLADTIQEPKEYHDISVIDLLAQFLAIHNSQVDSDKRIKLGAVTVTDTNDSLYRYTNYEDTLNAILDKLVDRLGGILRLRKEADGFYLDYLKDYPRTSNQAIEFGQNLTDLFKENSFQDIGTLLIPLGATLEEDQKDADFPQALEQRLTIKSVNNGSDVLQSADGIAEFGRIVKIATWDDVHTPEALYQKGIDYLNVIKYESKTITATAVDLSQAGIEIDDFKFLDRILCHSEPHDVDLSFPLTEVKIYPLNPESNQYTLGTTKRGYTKSSSQTLSEVKSIIEQKPSVSHVMKIAIDNATKILNNWASIGYAVHTENESFYMDSPDKDKAKYVLRLNMGGIGFSSTGINGPYKYAWTLDGTFNTEFINAGSITSDKLSVEYKDEVEKKIQTSEKSAKDLAENLAGDAKTDAINDTTEKLKSYWTVNETKTAIKNSENSILLSAEERAKEVAKEAVKDLDVSDALLNYYTKAQIDIKTNQITSSVEEAKTFATYEAISKANKALSDAKADATSKADKALADAESAMNLQLQSYYAKSEIDTKLGEINLSVAEERRHLASYNLLPNASTMGFANLGSGASKIDWPVNNVYAKYVKATYSSAATGGTRTLFTSSSLVPVRVGKNYYKLKFHVKTSTGTIRVQAYGMNNKLRVEKVETQISSVVNDGGTTTVEFTNLSNIDQWISIYYSCDFASIPSSGQDSFGLNIAMDARQTGEIQVGRFWLQKGWENNYDEDSLFTVSSLARLQVTANQITSEVNKKVNDADFGTKIVQNIESVQIAWNNISKYFKFENGRLNIYDDAQTQKLRMSLTEGGQRFYRDGYTVGNIGTAYWNKDDSKKSLAFNLDYQGAYMTWSSKTEQSESTYTVRLLYANTAFDDYQKNHFYFSGHVHFTYPLYLGDQTYCNNYYFNDPSFRFSDESSSALTGTAEVYLPTSSNFSSYYRCRVKRGLLLYTGGGGN